MITVAAALLSFLLTLAATRLVLAWLLRAAILDLPNERSNHARPTPRGGGLGVCLGIFAGWGLALAAGGSGGFFPAGFEGPVLAAALALAAVSFADDMRGLPVLPRLAASLAAVALVLAALPAEARLLDGAMPAWAERAALALVWLGFLNAYNFMDGIDGITGAVTAMLCLGVILVAAGDGGDVPALAAALLAASAGFLVFNWHPARLFLGDVGSVPLGFLAGALLLGLALRGAWAAALLLPAYYVVDTALTLLDRARRGERILQSHSRHAYQQAVRRGWRHDQVAGAIAALTAVEIVLALHAEAAPALSLAAGYALALALFWTLRSGRLDAAFGIVAPAAAAQPGTGEA